MSERGGYVLYDLFPHLILPGASFHKKLRLVNYGPKSVIYTSWYTTSPPNSPSRHHHRFSRPATTPPPTAKLRQDMLRTTPRSAHYHQPELYSDLAKLTAPLFISAKTHQTANTLPLFHAAPCRNGLLYATTYYLPRAKRISAIRSAVHKQSTF